jgi:DNA-binding response OmpR family regulator
MLDEKLLALNEAWMELQASLAQGAKIMLCLPDDAARATLVEGATAASASVTTVETANDAVQGLERQEFDLLIVAEDPPDMRALDLVRFIRGLPVTPKVIVLSQSPSPRKVLDAIQLGVADYLLEPEQGTGEILERTRLHLERLGRRKLQLRMVTDLRRLHQDTPPEERGMLIFTLKRQLEQFRQNLGPMNRVLIVDADTLVRRQLSSALGGMGLMPSGALGGNSALELLAAEGADLVIISGDLPDIQTAEMVGRINDITGTIPVVLLADLDEIDPALSALRMGFADCIRKPIASPDHAAHRVARVLKDRRRELLADNLIRRLYRLMRTASEALAPDATSQVEQVFDDMIVVEPTDADGTDATQTPRGISDEALAQAAAYQDSPEEGVRLTTGEVEIIADLDDGPDVTNADFLPDTVIIEYIDELLFTSGGEGQPHSGIIGAGQRLTPRVERSTFVRYGSSGTEEASLGYAHDLSLGGMFILSEDPPPVSTDLQIELQLQDQDKIQRVRIQGRVMWHTNPDRRPPQGDGFGVQFTVVDRHASAAIRRAVTD